MNDDDLALRGFKQRNRSGQGVAMSFAVLFLITLGTFTYLYIRLSSAFETRPRFVVVSDPSTLLIAQEQSFIEAKAVHVLHAQLAAQAIFNRSPKGLDNTELAKRVLGRAAYEKLLKMIEDETPEFTTKNLRRKIEVASVNLVKLQDRSVGVSVLGQIIRTGDFQGQLISEASNVKLDLHFIHNGAVATNGNYPVVATEFKIEVEAIPAR